MKLSKKAVRELAEMICGGSGGYVGPGYGWDNFVYRSGPRLVEFFDDAGVGRLEFLGSRQPWTQQQLERFNELPSEAPDLPSRELILVIREMMSPSHFRGGLDRGAALKSLNEVLGDRDRLEVVDTSRGVQFRTLDGRVISDVQNASVRAWSPEELKRRNALAHHLDTLSEDAFTETVLVPVFQQLGFDLHVAGHKDKALEYGKDAWMKFQMPTGHWLYCAMQVKIGKIDARGASTRNVTEILTQVQMALGHPVTDLDLNKRVLPDHVYVVSSGDITKQAQNWLAEKLDYESRRTLMFIGRDQILDLAIRTKAHLPGFDPDGDEKPAGYGLDDEIPF